MKKTISNNLSLLNQVIDSIEPSSYPEDKLFKIINSLDNDDLNILSILQEHKIIITDDELWKKLNFALLNGRVDYQTNEKEYELYNQFTTNNRLFSLSRYYDEYVNLPMNEDDYQKAISTLREVL